MTPDRAHLLTRTLRRKAIGVVGTLAMLAAILGAGAASVAADPADDALAKLNELSRQAEQTTELMHTAELDLDKKLAEQKAAEDRSAAARAELDEAKGQLATYQRRVDKLAGAMYMGGRTDGLSAIMTADSPQRLIDELSAQDAMGTQMVDQMTRFRELSARAAAAEKTTAESAAAARTAAEQAAAVRADVQGKQSELQRKIAIVRAQYEALTPQQRTALAEPGPLPGPPPPPPGDPAVLAAAPNAVPPGDLAPPPPTGGGSPAGAIAVQAALTRIGSPYSWGGSGPGQFDCSGLVMWSFQQAGISLPHSSQALARGGQPVSMDQIQPGDVVNYYSDASHTAIYIGDGMMVHASTYGTPVKVAPVANAPIYNIRRY
ncbi:peptidoglycan hydrolase RipC [Mycobacterium sp. MYCO198283]|uniref:peptidoglycan hydrolase RipC n=1 Tax=Mycobacterium sp. MYCO198283 TaxID=2883505 RepID=UPI001E36F605|nr:peptidoglycan hydrolase RipC [Mycobacterium sp. MYCO198283]MCG5432702.1 peptidoglycan hydrolase RipC [Mycobacterium sp. MYCO198283]